MNRTGLDLVVAGLLPSVDSPPAMRGVRLPALEKWLARAQVEAHPCRGRHAWLAGEFALPASPPVAAIELAADEPALEGTWFRVDPVHLRLGHNAAALHAPESLDIARDEADALVDALRSHFGADGLEFRTGSPEHWYVRTPGSVVAETVPIEEAFGRNVLGLLPPSGGDYDWRRALTEAQMVLAAHPVNSARESEGRPRINSVWLWGGGARPAHTASPYATVHADDRFARGLARVSGARISPTPARLADVEPSPHRTLVVVDSVGRAFARADSDAWVAAALAIDHEWFAAIGEAVARFGDVRLVLPGHERTVVAKLDSRSRLRWFRSRKALLAYA